MNPRSSALVLALLTLSPIALGLFTPAQAGVLDRAPPDPLFVVSPGEGTTATLFELDASGSHVPPGTQVLVEWGDGAVDASLVASHQYARAGDFVIRLHLRNPERGDASAYALVRVRAMEPEAWAAHEAERLEGMSLLPNHVILPGQEFSLDVQSPGVVAALVDGIQPAALPLGSVPGGPTLKVVSCDADACAEVQDVANLTDPDGVSTLALSVLLQKVLNATYYAIDVTGPDGRVTLPALARGLDFARSLGPVAVVSLLPPDAGFLDDAAAVNAYDPDLQTGRYGTPSLLQTPERLAFLRALAANRARYDFGDNGTYPVPNGFNETRAPDHGHGYGGGHAHGGGYGHGATALLHSPADGCIPSPRPGPREDLAQEKIATYERYEDALKDYSGITSRDLQTLSPVESAALIALTRYHADLTCLHHALSHLAHEGVPVVVAAGDNAYHARVTDPVNATWDLQSLRGISEFPQVITVGATTSTAYGTSGTTRVVLPSSAAGPTRSLHGVKPDLVAPADVPGVLVGSAYASGAWWAPERNSLYDGFRYDRTGGLVLGNATLQSERLNLHPSDLDTGIAYTGSRDLAPRPALNASVTLSLPSGNATRNVFRLAAQDGVGYAFSKGFGLELVPLADGRVNATTLVRVNGAEYDPPCVGVCPPTVKTVTVDPAGGLELRVSSAPSARAGHDLLTFEIRGGDGLVRATMAREMPVNATGHLCACRHVTFLSGLVNAGATRWAEATLDNVTAVGLSGPAQATYGEDMPLGQYGVNGVRPGTRVAAAYAAGVAIVHVVPLLVTEPDPVERLVRLRGVLAGLSKPLPDVPPFVQGAGELNLDAPGSAFTLLNTEHQAPGVPGIDYGVRLETDTASAYLEFHWNDYLGAHQVHVETSGLTWWRVDRDLRVVRTSGSSASLSAQSRTQDDDTRSVWVNVTAMPLTEGVYATYLPVGIGTGIGPANPLYTRTQVPVLLTRGVAPTLDLADLDAPVGATAWLLPPLQGKHLVYDPLPGGPVANGTLDADRRVFFGRVGPAGYSLALAVSASLPVPDDASPEGLHEAGRPREFVVVSKALRPYDGNGDVSMYDPAARLPTPVAFRFLDYVESTAFSWRQADPRATNGQILSGAANLTSGRWRPRGDPRPAGHALEEPLPVGETVVGWDLRAVGRAPDVGLQSTADVRADYEAALASATYRPTALTGHLDPRPYGWMGSRDLPALVLQTEVTVPRPLDSLHGTLLLPLDVDEATVLLRVTAGDQSLTTLLTSEGAWVNAPEKGDLWPAEGHDRWDDLPDFHEGGVLSGWGHLHLRGQGADLRLVPRTPNGYLVPLGFHDLPSDLASVTVQLLLRPDPTGLAGRAFSTGPLDPVPGPRFRLDGAALYAWTAGMAARDTFGTASVSLGATGRFDLPAGAQPDPLHEPVVRLDPLHEGGQPQGEFLELYARSERDRLRLSGVTTVSSGSAGIARGTLGAPESEQLSFAHGRGVNGVYDPLLHPFGVLRPYALVTPLDRAVHERFVDFASLGPSLWRVDGKALLQASGPTGALTLQFRDGNAMPAAPLAPIPVRFPDMPDPSPSAATGAGDCSYDGLGLVGVLVGNLARLGCYRIGPAGYDGPAAVSDEREATGVSQDSLTGQSGACVDAQATQPCSGDVLEMVDSPAGTLWSRFVSLRDTLLGNGSLTPTSRSTLWDGVVPARGALLVLEHRVSGSGLGAVNATLLPEGVEHRLVTLEGQEAFRATDPRLRTDRMDVFDLSGYSGQRIRLDLVKEGSPAWTVSAWRVLPLATPAVQEPSLSPALLDPADAFPRPSPVLRSVPSGDAVRAGPAQSSVAATPGTRLVHLASGLDVTASVKLEDRHLLVGRDVDEGAVLRVRSGATLALEDLTLAPRSFDLPWGIVVESGGVLKTDNVTLLGGGHPASGLAAIEVLPGGAAYVNFTDVLGGETGVKLHPGATLVSLRATYARNLRAVDADGATATLLDAFVDGNVQGVVARNATVEIFGGIYTANREGALQLQDTLAALSGATFAWNGEAGPRAAVSAYEGLDNGRVVLHDVRFVGDATALHARAPVDAHDLSVKQAETAIRVGPAVTFRLDHANVTSTGGSAFLLDAGSRLYANASVLAGTPWADCGPVPPALVWTDRTTRIGPDDPECPAGTHLVGADTDAQESRWRAVVVRPWLRGGAHPVLLLPYGSDATLVDVDDADKRDNLTIESGRLTVLGADRVLRIEAAPASGAPATHAWGYDLVKDTLAPTGGLTLLAGAYRGEDGALYFRPFSAALALDATDSGSGAGAHALLLDSLNPDGTPGARGARVHDAMRGSRAVLGNGAPAALTPVTGENVTLTPVLRDRAGNVAPGKAVSVVYDRTPPRAWLHAANPCGDLFGYDLGWKAHDPRVGVGLRPAGVPPNATQNWTYVLSVASVNLSATVDLGDIDTLVDIVDLGTVDRLLQANPQGLNAVALKELDRRLNDPLNGKWLTDLPLIDWIEIGRFTRDEESLHLSLVRDLNDMLERNLNFTEARARELLEAKNETDAWLQAVAEARLEDVDAHERVNVTLDQVLPHLEQELANVRKLTPVILAIRIEARDALGNSEFWYEPVLSDVFSPTHLLYLLGDAVRERVVPLLLAPRATLDLADLHGELTIFDPDCGLQDLTILERLPNNVTTPIATVYPREGRVTFDVFGVQDLFPANLCGERTLDFQSTDVFGRTSLVTVDTVLDRVAPVTSLVDWSKVSTVPLLPVEPDVLAPVADPAWVNGQGVEVDALAQSLNLPACPVAWASIHDVAVEASVDNVTWVRLAQQHFGAARNGTLVNTTVTFNGTAPIEAKDFGMTDAELSGQWVNVRVMSDDEAGNEETQANATFGFRVDTKPPLCTIDHVEASGGRTLPVGWHASDVDQSVPGQVINASLLVRPSADHPAQETDMEWVLFAWLPQPVGTANAVLSTSPLPAWATAPILHDLDIACAAYDQAGNLAVGPAARTLLDLELPIVNWTTMAPHWANAVVVLNWTVDELVSGMDYLLLYANKTGHDLALRVNYTAQFNNSWTLDPVALSGEPGGMDAHNGENWTVVLEAHDKAGNVYPLPHTILFDTTAPSGNLLNVIDGLVGGYLPVSLYEFVPNMTQGTALPQSPFDPRLEVQDAAGTTTFRLGADGKFHLSFATDGAKSMRLLPCDAAGNCGAPTGWVPFNVDLARPIAVVTQIADGATLPVSTLPGGGATVSVASGPSTSARLRVTDANGQSSGIAGLQVRLRPLNSFTREPMPGAALEATVTDLGVVGGFRQFSAAFSGLASEQLYRVETIATDAAGNRETGPEGWSPLATYVAYDATPPAAILGSIAPWFNAPPVKLPITLRDDVNGIGVGVASYQVRVRREAGAYNTSNVAPANGATWSNVTWSDNGINVAVDEGVLLTYCVVPKDRFGRSGSCDGAAQTFLDDTLPTVSLVMPADALTDPWTKQLPAQVGVKVVNTAPGARAAPIGEVMLEVATQDLSRPPSFRFDLAANGITLGANAEYTKTFDLGASDGQIYLLGGYAADAAGNRRLPGQAASRNENRNTTEWGLYSFDVNDNANDLSGNGNHLAFPGGVANPPYQLSIHRGGRGATYDGDAYHYRTGTMGLGNALTAMVWVYPTTADQTAGILGRTQLARDWGLWLEGGYPKATVETTGGAFNTLTGATKLPVNQWSHLALTYDGQFVRLYVNGESAAPQGPLTGSVSESAGANLMVGAALQGTVKGFVGHMDEVRLYRTGLSAADVRDLKDYPYWNGVAQTPLHVDVTAPLSAPAPHDLLQALPTVNAHAYDLGAGKPSLVKSVRLEERVLDSGLYTATPVAKEGWLEIAQTPNREIPQNAEFRWTHPLRLPSYPMSVNVRLAVNDSVAPPGNAPGCSPQETGVGANRARWRVYLGATEVGGRYVGATPHGDTVYHLNATTVSGPTDLILSVTSLGGPWKACYPRLNVRFDDVSVLSGGQAVFNDQLLEKGQWTSSAAGDSATASFVQASVPWSEVPAANARYAESWDVVHNRGWELQTGADTLARTDVVPSGTDGLAFSLIFEGSTGGASSLYDRAGKAFSPGIDASHLFVTERTTRQAATTATRPGVQVDVGSSSSIVFTFEDSLVGSLPTRVDAFTGRTYYYVPVTGARTSGAWNGHLLDVAAAKQSLGLTGPVTGLHAYLEKQVTPLPGQTFGATVTLDDVRLLDGARARIDLPFRFPYYGKTYTTVYADVDGVLGFEPDFDASRTTAAFNGQRVLAPAWADWTLAGVDETANFRPHGIYVDRTLHNQTTLVWMVGAAGAPGRTQAFAATLMETGEILTTYREVPDSATLHRVGLSAGDGRRLDRTASVPGFTGAEDGYLPGDGVWRVRDAKAPQLGLAVTPDTPLHLRTVAVDNADNEQATGLARGKVTRDSQPPLVRIQPVLDYLGGLPNRDLRVLTTLLDNHTTIDAGSVTMRVWDLTGASSPNVDPPAQGENVTTATPFDVVHRSLYALNLTAKDRFGQLGWANHTFQAVIKPEPELDLVRALDGGVLVDDVLVGAGAGLSGTVSGDRFSAAGTATVASGSLWLNVTLDGQVLATQSGPGASFSTATDAAGLPSGAHTYRVRVETPNGSFAEESYTFQLQNGTGLASTDVENDTARWWTPAFPSGDVASPHPDAARRGALGVRVHAVTDAAYSAFAQYNLTTPAPAGRHWAFVRAPAAPTGSGFEVLRLDASAGTAFSARVDSAMTLWALDDGTWVNTTRVLHAGHWKKVEAKDDGANVALYLNHTYVGTYGRTAPGAVTAYVFAANAPSVAGDLHVDDVGGDRADPIRRVLLQDDMRFHTTTWQPSNASAFTTDSFGRRGLKVDSTVDRNMTANLSVPAVPDYLVSLDVGLLGRGCAGTGHVLRVLDAAGGSVLRLECSGAVLRASDGAGLATPAVQLVNGRYNRIVAHVGTGSYTLFVNDRLAGVFDLSSALPAAKVRLGGGNAELWYNDVAVARGRLLVSDGFDAMLSSAWRLPAQSATLETTRTADQAITGNHTVKVHSAGALNEVGPLLRPTPIPARALVGARVYVPATATFDDFTALGLGNANGVEVSIVLGRDGIDPALRVGVKRGTGVTWMASPTLAPGWHSFAIRVEQDVNRWVPYWNGAPLNVGDTFTGAALDHLVFGDWSLAAGQGTMYLDDVQMLAMNAPPALTLDAPADGATVARGTVLIQGTAHDRDPADAPDRIELLLDGKVVHVANAPAWSYAWDTSALAPGSVHTLSARAWQSDGRGLYVDVPARTVTIQT